MMRLLLCTAVAYMVLVTGVQGFVGSGLLPGLAGLRSAPDSSTTPWGCSARLSPCMTASEATDMGTGAGSSRGEFVKSVVAGGAVGLAAVFSPGLSEPAAAVAQSLEEITSDLIICKEVFKPTLQYLKAEQFDAARTNTNYITRFFNLKKKIDAFIVQVNDVVDDPDKIEKAFDMAQEVESLFTNFDSSVYTIIFIPADASGVLPPGAEKYLKQAYGFYDDINRVFDFYLGLVPPETRAAADKLLPAKRATLPKFLFKEDSALMREKVAIS